MPLLLSKSILALSLLLSIPFAAKADDLYAGVDRSCVRILTSFRYSVQQARGLCAQYTMSEKQCLISFMRRHSDFRRAQNVCLQVEGDRYPPYDESPYPWARSGGYCEIQPNDIYCQEGFGW